MNRRLVLTLSALTIFMLTGVISAIPSASAVEQNGVIQMPFTNNPPIIDGQWTSADEWKDASRTTMSNGNYFAFLYTEHDRDYIYTMIDFVGDQTKSLSTDPQHNGDSVFVCFDTNNDGSNQLENADFCFVVAAIYNNPDHTEMQTGSSTSTGFSVIASPPPSGFAAVPGFSSTNDPNESGRDHRIYEMKIPLTFLHKQDKFGFSATVHDGSSDIHTSVQWPVSDKTDSWNPSTYGTLMAPNQSISAPPVPVISVSPQSLSFGNEEVSGKSNTQTVTISNIGTGLLKISNIQTQGEFSVSDTNTPIEIPPSQSTSFNVVLAPITTGPKSGQITIYSNDISNPAYILSVSGTGVEKSTTPFGGRCLIATAAFGSELSPQVQFLRGFRDNHILATESGSSFMTVFNAWYYSFSPYVADYERQQPWLQQTVRASIYPLLGILTLSEKGFSTVQGDYGAVVAGAVASSMIGAVYFWPFALSIKQVRKNRFDYKIMVYVIGSVSASVIGSILVSNQYALMITTSLFVLTLLSVSAMLVAKLITKTKKEFSKKSIKT